MNNNSIGAKFWIPMILMLLVTCGSLIFGIVQGGASKASVKLEIQVDKNTTVLVEHAIVLGIMETKLTQLANQQDEMNRKLSAALQGINNLSQDLRIYNKE